MSKYKREDVKKHNTKDDLWIIIDNNVYNITGFAKMHPGGQDVFNSVAGGDATDLFHNMKKHKHSHLASIYLKRFFIGTILVN